jgi:5-methylcytosine-specific restriction enzyme A
MLHKAWLKKETVYLLCDRSIPDSGYLEKHHSTPVAKGGKKTELVCIDCGDQIHELFTNNELRDTYNSIEKLKGHPRVQTWIKWVRKQKNFGICMKKKKKR